MRKNILLFRLLDYRHLIAGIGISVSMALLAASVLTGSAFVSDTGSHAVIKGFAILMLILSISAAIMTSSVLVFSILSYFRTPRLDEKTIDEMKFNDMLSFLEKPRDKNYDAVLRHLSRHWFLSDTIVQMSPIFMITIGADKRIIMSNRALLDRTGYSIGEVSGRFFRELIHETQEWAALDTIGTDSSDKHDPVMIETTLRCKDGSLLPVEWYCRAIEKSDGSLDFIIDIGIDITDRKQKEYETRIRLEFENFLTLLSQRFINLDMDAIDPEIIHTLEDLAAYAHVDAASIYKFTDDMSGFSCTYEWRIAQIQNSQHSKRIFMSNDFPFFMDYMKRQEVFNAPDIEALPEEAVAERELFLKVGMKSMICIPIHAAGSLKGFIGFSTVNNTVAWSKDMISLLTIAGEIIASSLIRRDAARDLANSEERFSIAMQAANEGLWEYLIPSEKLYYSPRWYTMLGYEPGELPMTVDTWLTLLHPDDRPNAENILSNHLRYASEDYYAEFRLKTKQGGWRWILSRGKTVEFCADGSPQRLVGTHVDITDLKRIMKEKEQIVSLIENSVQFVGMSDMSGTVTYINEAGKAIAGITDTYPSDLSLFDIITLSDQDNLRFEILQALAARGEWKGENRVRNLKTGVISDVLINAFVIRDSKTNEATSFAVIMNDMTELKRLEKKANQSQKLESIGRLAGGIAHDFNNLLTVILGNADFLLMTNSETSDSRNELLEIKKTAERAAEMTRQLLTFSRTQSSNPRIININDTLHDMEKMMKRLIGETIQIDFIIADNLWPVKADPVHIQQIMTNLVVNARDAMPYGGNITVQTMNVVLDPRKSNNPDIETISGDFVLLAVGDTGIGIDADILPHIFEPFFTTKEQGKGTGLGLSTCFGIVKQNNGDIQVQSEMGRGTVVKIYLPRIKENIETTSPIDMMNQLPKGDERILVVEDEASVRKTIVRLLGDLGYSVESADNPNEALALISSLQTKGGIDLLVTDVIMPVMTGGELYRRVSEMYPHTKVLFISGYSGEALTSHGVPETGAFIQKPFAARELAGKIREILDI